MKNKKKSKGYTSGELFGAVVASDINKGFDFQQKNKQYAKEFENMILNSKLNALKKVSLERPLKEDEFLEFKKLSLKKIGGEF
jgi:hypothetical protein